MRQPERRSQPLLVAQWKYLWCQEFVEVRRGGQMTEAGWIDDITADGASLWIHLKDGLGRVMIHRDDGVEIWRVDSRVLQNRGAACQLNPLTPVPAGDAMEGESGILGRA